MLERKISHGKLLETAAEEAGIPIEEARAWLEKRRENESYDDDSLRFLAAKAMSEGMNALIKAARDDEGRIKAEGGEFGGSFEYLDVEAAKALVQVGLKVRGMLQKNKKAPSEAQGGDDLFDRAGGDWSFPKPR